MTKPETPYRKLTGIKLKDEIPDRQTRHHVACDGLRRLRRKEEVDNFSLWESTPVNLNITSIDFYNEVPGDVPVIICTYEAFGGKSSLELHPDDFDMPIVGSQLTQQQEDGLKFLVKCKLNQMYGIDG